MPFSKFTTALLDSGTARVGGPFGFSPDEQKMTVASLSFVLVQGDQLVHGTGGAEGGKWDGEAKLAQNLEIGQPVQAFGIALLVQHGPQPAFQTYGWSDQVELA
jgi:hypothetical protein